MSDFKRSCALLIFGFLLPSFTGCGFSFGSASERSTAVPEPKIWHDRVSTIPSLNARLTKLAFFGSGPSDVGPVTSPRYQTRFDHTVTTRVHPVIHLDYPPPGKKIYFTVTVHVREKARTFRIVDYDTRIEPDWTSSYHSVDVGVLGPGNWQVGTYEADVHINGEKMATGYFEVF